MADTDVPVSEATTDAPAASAPAGDATNVPSPPKAEVPAAESKAETAVPDMPAPVVGDTKFDLQRLLQSHDAYVTVVVVMVIVTALKRSLLAIDKNVLERPYVKVFFEWSGPLIAMALARLPGLWDDFSAPLDMIVAMPAGFFAERIYKSVLSRVLPGWVLSGDAPMRKDDKGQG